MKILLFLFIFFCIFRIFLYRKFRVWLAMRRRHGVYPRLIQKIKSIHRFKLRVNKKIPYIGYFGANKQQADIFYIVTSLAHGLETLPAEIHADFLIKLDERSLVENKICLVSIPILNHWGLINGARTTKNGTDLLRNSPYRSKHPKKIWLLSGWNNPLFWVFAKTIGFSYYFQGFKVDRIMREFYRAILPLLRSGKKIIFFDLHTGNNDHRTTIWKHELDDLDFPDYMKKSFSQYSIHAEAISYGTDGAFIEYCVEKFGNHITGYTIEFSVLEKSGQLHYSGQSSYGDVFDPPVDIRKAKIKTGLEQFSKLLNLHY